MMEEQQQLMASHFLSLPVFGENPSMQEFSGDALVSVGINCLSQFDP